MPRARAEAPPPEAILALVDGENRLAVRVTPGAREESLMLSDGRLLAKVRAKPEDGKANLALIALLAKALGIAGSRLVLLRGASSREKVFRLER